MEYVSTTTLAKMYDAETAHLFEELCNAGWINRINNKWTLTSKGKQMGGIMKSSPQYGEYIAWPESIDLSSLDNGEDEMLTSTKVGNHFKVSSQRMNLILSELGWIQKHVAGWCVTKQGKAVGGLQCEHETSGANFVVWPKQILQNKNLLSVFVDEPKKDVSASAPVKNDTPKNIDSFREKFEAKHRTQDGHYVRSRAELIIDNLLYQYSLAHAYERKVPIEEDLYCDFYLPAGKVYIEYWGMENDPKYLERKKIKLELYKKSEVNLIEINDDEIMNLDDYLPKKLLKFGIKVY
jgi:hypothetical protein